MFLVLGLTSARAQLEEGDTLETLIYNGEEFSKIHIRKITPAYIEVMHSYGGEKVYIHKLDDETRKNLFPNFSLEKAKAFVANERELGKNELQRKKEEVLKLLEDNKDKIRQVAMLRVIHNVGASGFLAICRSWENKGGDIWELTESDIVLIANPTKVSSGQLIPRKIAREVYEDKMKLYEIGDYTYITGEKTKKTVKKYTFSGKTFIEYLESEK